jgi:hypothetical protein
VNGQARAIPIALFTYQTLSQEDYKRFISAYVLLNESTAEWAPRDFGKPNIEKLGAVHQDWHPSSAEVHVEETGDAHRIVARLEIKDEEAFQSGRACFPRMVFLELVLPKAEPVIQLNLSCFQKARDPVPRGSLAHLQSHCGRPEGMDLSINPASRSRPSTSVSFRWPPYAQPLAKGI